MASISSLQMRLTGKQTLIDKEFRPSKLLFDKDAKAYMKQWKAYIKQTEMLVKEFHAWLDYYPSLAEERANPDKPRTRSHKSAAVELSKTAKKLNDEIGWEFMPHFHKELEKLKAKHKDYSRLLNLLDTSSPKAFDQSFKNITKDLPKYLKADLKKLPYKHPAVQFLKLPSYNEINRDAERIRQEKGENISSLNINQVKYYVEKVYNERHQNPDYACICLALQFATGRRRAELGLISTVTQSKIEGHIHIDRFAKANNTQKTHDLPVILLTVPQVIELYTLLRERLEAVFSDKPKIWREIKATKNTDSFDDYTKRVRTEFLKEFKLRVLDTTDSDLKNLTTHNACRSFYAQYAYQHRDKQYKKMSLQVFANRLLGHVKGDHKTTENYLRVELVDKPFNPDTTQIAENEPSTLPEAPAPEMGDELEDNATRPKIDPFKPKKARPLERANAEPTQAARKTRRSALTAQPQKIIESDYKHTPNKPKAIPSSSSVETKTFFAAVRSPKFKKELALYSLRIKNPGLLDIQRAMITKIDTIPSLADLTQFASENTARLYLKFLQKHGLNTNTNKA